MIRMLVVPYGVVREAYSFGFREIVLDDNCKKILFERLVIVIPHLNSRWYDYLFSLWLKLFFEFNLYRVNGRVEQINFFLKGVHPLTFIHF